MMHAWLIGSRAWLSDYEDHVQRDWDLVVTRKNFIETLKAPGVNYLISGISYDSITDGKFKLYTYSPRTIEIEIEDRYKSNKLLKHLQASPGITSTANLRANWKLRLEPISKVACAVLKSSHIFFPINWRKNAIQLAHMKDHLKKKSLQDLINEEKRKRDLNELFYSRSRETLARINRNVKSNLVTRNNEALSNWNKSILDQFLPENESDTDYFPTTDSRISKSKFRSSSEDDKLKLIDDQLQLISALYFNNNPSLSVKDIYLLSLETFCCQQIARSPSTHDKLFRRTELVYHRENYECNHEEGRRSVDDVLAAIQKDLPNEEFELANDEEVAKSTLGNSVIQWLVENWSVKVLTPSPQFTEFVSKIIPVNVTLPTLPIEMITIIFKKTQDHLTLSAISSLNKEFRSEFNTNDQWQALISSIWGSEAVNYGTNFDDHQSKWREVFKALYKEAKAGPFVYCKHCSGVHSVFSESPYDNHQQEWEWDHCPCADCDADSWMKCEYRDEFMY